ncbi:hypothetical protein F5144DRAFT_585459 [Chaetomium tenue]|uniref:Uncharacterized protein n=1 Tax=Chaetomium tenue TaxID=1854479 RepID=A0ACB7NY33_9PEZI|nr:hypothetical protein F5144DRAFT_585459 [Chaetomium globosum]
MGLAWRHLKFSFTFEAVLRTQKMFSRSHVRTHTGVSSRQERAKSFLAWDSGPCLAKFNFVTSYLITQRPAGHTSRRRESRTPNSRSHPLAPSSPPTESRTHSTLLQVPVPNIETPLSHSLLLLRNNLSNPSTLPFKLLRARLQHLRRPPQRGCDEVRWAYLEENVPPYVWQRSEGFHLGLDLKERALDISHHSICGVVEQRDLPQQLLVPLELRPGFFSHDEDPQVLEDGVRGGAAKPLDRAG